MRMSANSAQARPRRHRRHDDDGADEAFELRRENQQDDDQREAEDGDHAAVRLTKSGGFGERYRCARRGGAGRWTMPCATASASPRAKSGRRLVVMATEGCCCSRVSDGATARSRQRGDGRHRHIASVRRLEEHVLEVGRIVDRVGGRDQLHGIAAVADVDVADLVAVEHRLLRVGQPADLDAEVGGAGAIELDCELRLRGVNREARLLKARVLLQLVDDFLRRRAELRAVIADQRELQAVAGAANAQAVRLHGENAQAWHLFRQLGDFGRDLLLSSGCAGPMAPASSP